MGERERTRVEAGKDPNWPPKVAHLQETMQSEIFTPLPFTPTMGSGSLGPVFEWREYTMRPGGQGGAGAELVLGDRGTRQDVAAGDGDGHRMRRAQQVRPYLGL